MNIRLNTNAMTEAERKVHSTVSFIEVTIPIKNLLNGKMLSHELSKDQNLYAAAKQYMDTLIKDILVYDPDRVTGIRFTYCNKILKIYVRNSYPMSENSNNNFAEFTFSLQEPFSINHFIESIDKSRFIDDNDKYVGGGNPVSRLSSNLAIRNAFIENIDVLDKALEQNGKLLNTCRKLPMSPGFKFNYSFFKCELKTTVSYYTLSLTSPVLDIEINQFVISFKKINVFDSSFSTTNNDNLIDFITMFVKQALLFNNKYDFDMSSRVVDMLKIIEIDLH